MILIKTFPDAITMVDASERMPFVPLLEDWCLYVYEKHEEDSKKRRPREEGVFRLPIGRVTEQFNDRVDTLWAGSQESFGTLGLNQGIASGALHAKASRLYPRSQIWEEVVFALEMLSLIMDELGGKNGGLHHPDGCSGSLLNSSDKKARTDLAAHIVSAVPSLIKTILLIDSDGGEVRRKLLGMSIFRRIRLCPQSVGPWLTDMLRKRGVPAKRAVDYMILVSDVTAEDFVGGFRTILAVDFEEFDNAKREVFDSVEKLQGTVASLVVLEERDIDRAVSSSVVWHIMNKNLARPFVVGFFLIEFVILVTLLLAVRSATTLSDSDTLGASLGNVPTQIVLVICSFLLIKKIVEGISLFHLSVTIFRAYITNIFTLLDILTLGMTVAVVSYGKSNPGQYRNGVNALVVGLLWLRILG